MADRIHAGRPEFAKHSGYATAADAVLDPRGVTLRCVPWRRTVRRDAARGRVVYAKLRYGRSAEAAAEWRALGQLAQLGLRGPEPLLFARHRRDSVIVTGAVPGRPIDVLLREQAALGGDALARFVRRATTAVAPVIARLHASGHCYRDLYWNHLFLDGDQLGWIDPERMFRPRWRRRRWIVKDLAGLLASLPVAVPAAARLRFLRSYDGGTPAPGWRALARAVGRKAARIRAHRPRYGG